VSAAPDGWDAAVRTSRLAGFVEGLVTGAEAAFDVTRLAVGQNLASDPARTAVACRGAPLVERCRSVVEGSALWTLAGVGLETALARWLAALDRSAVSGLAGFAARAARAAWLCRWLTAEPEPEVVVIDLRETWSVGPVLAVIEDVLTSLLPAAATARLTRAGVATEETVRAAPVRAASVVVGTAAVVATLGGALTGRLTDPAAAAAGVVLVGSLAGLRVRLTWAELVETRPVQLLVAALEPPAPPEGWDEP